VNAAVNSEPRTILYWFHVSMRLRPIKQMAVKGAGALETDEPDMATFVTQSMPNIRHQMLVKPRLAEHEAAPKHHRQVPASGMPESRLNPPMKRSK